jgi:hypothetical protein
METEAINALSRELEMSALPPLRDYFPLLSHRIAAMRLQDASAATW